MPIKYKETDRICGKKNHCFVHPDKFRRFNFVFQNLKDHLK